MATIISHTSYIPTDVLVKNNYIVQYSYMNSIDRNKQEVEVKKYFRVNLGELCCYN